MTYCMVDRRSNWEASATFEDSVANEPSIRKWQSRSKSSCPLALNITVTENNAFWQHWSCQSPSQSFSQSELRKWANHSHRRRRQVTFRRVLKLWNSTHRHLCHLRAHPRPKQASTLLATRLLPLHSLLLLLQQLLPQISIVKKLSYNFVSNMHRICSIQRCLSEKYDQRDFSVPNLPGFCRILRVYLIFMKLTSLVYDFTSFLPQ